MTSYFFFLSYERFSVATALLPNTSLGLPQVKWKEQKSSLWAGSKVALGASVSLGEEISLLGSRGAQGGILKINPGRAAWTGFGGWGSGVRPEKESGLVATKHVKLPSRPGEKQEEGAALESTANR